MQSEMLRQHKSGNESRHKSRNESQEGKVKKKKTLEDKIEKAQNRIVLIKEELRIANLQLTELQRKKVMKDSSKPGALKRLILAHKPCDCDLSNAFAILITILRISDKHAGRSKLLYLFPFKEKGYKGYPGDCLLAGHVAFSDSEKEILRRYGIKWSYGTYGNIMGH